MDCDMDQRGGCRARHDKPNYNETGEGSALDQPIIETHQNASLSTEVAGENASDHQNHPDGITTLPRTEERDMLPAEGKQANLDDSKQNAPVTTETHLNENNNEDRALTR